MAEKGLDQALADLGEDGAEIKAGLLSPKMTDYLTAMLDAYKIRSGIYRSDAARDHFDQLLKLSQTETPDILHRYGVISSINPTATAPRKTLKDRLSFLNILNKKKAADTDSTVEKADNENTNDNGEL